MPSMKNMTCIEDLRQVASRRVPRAFFDYAEAGSYAQETLRANRADLEKIKLRQRVLVDVSERDTGTTILGENVPRAARSVDRRHERPHAWQRRDPCLPRRAGRRHSLYAQHDVDLLDRGRGGCRRQAVLVPALRHEGPRLRARADRARHRRQMQRAGADRRPAGARPAPCRHPQRAGGAAVAEAQEPHQHGDQIAAGSTACCRASAGPSAISPAM